MKTASVLMSAAALLSAASFPAISDVNRGDRSNQTSKNVLADDRTDLELAQEFLDSKVTALERHIRFYNAERKQILEREKLKVDDFRNRVASAEDRFTLADLNNIQALELANLNRSALEETAKLLEEVRSKRIELVQHERGLSGVLAKEKRIIEKSRENIKGLRDAINSYRSNTIREYDRQIDRIRNEAKKAYAEWNNLISHNKISPDQAVPGEILRITREN